MPKYPNQVVWISISIVISVISCNFPHQVAPTPFEFPTVDFTLTAIFDHPALRSTATNPGIIIATSTFAPPTEIFANLPTDTATEEPSPTKRLTKTNAPTQSFAGPSERPGNVIRVAFLKNPPTIDGIFDEWKGDRYDMNYVVYGEDYWTGSVDLSGNFMAGWDENFLYLAVRVKDEVYRQEMSDKYIYKGDSVEILLDTNVGGDYYLNQLSGDDFQLGISPGRPSPGVSPEAYLWYPGNRESPQNSVKIGATQTDDGYRLEVKIPWGIFLITPHNGQHFGFALSVSDNDSTNKDIQQSMVSSVSGRNFLYPMSWGGMTLVK